jgi:hypothetical protein
MGCYRSREAWLIRRKLLDSFHDRICRPMSRAACINVRFRNTRTATANRLLAVMAVLTFLAQPGEEKIWEQACHPCSYLRRNTHSTDNDSWPAQTSGVLANSAGWGRRQKSGGVPTDPYWRQPQDRRSSW